MAVETKEEVTTAVVMMEVIPVTVMMGVAMAAAESLLAVTVAVIPLLPPRLLLQAGPFLQTQIHAVSHKAVRCALPLFPGRRRTLLARRCAWTVLRLPALPRGEAKMPRGYRQTTTMFSIYTTAGAAVARFLIA